MFQRNGNISIAPAGGFVGIGTSTNQPISKLQVVGEAGDNTDLVFLDRYTGSNGLANSAFVTRKARGTQASPSNVLINDGLGGIGMRGYANTGFTTGSNAYVFAYALQNWSGSGTGTRLDFGVTPNTSATVATYMSLTSVQLNVSATKMYVENITVTNLKGTGNDYVCVDASGVFYRSDSACA